MPPLFQKIARIEARELPKLADKMGLVGEPTIVGQFAPYDFAAGFDFLQHAIEAQHPLKGFWREADVLAPKAG